MIYLQKCFSGICALVFAMSVEAQSLQPPVGNYTPKNYGDSHVPENYSICKDERGFIYSGNVGGLLQYDGHSWQFLEIETGIKVDAIAYIGDQNIACGGGNMIGIMEPQNNGAYKYRSLVSKIPESSKPFNIVTIQKIGKKIFFQSENAIFIYENNKISTVLPEKSFFRMYSCEGRVFVRDRSIGLKEWKKNHFEIFASDTLSKDYGYMGMVNYDKNSFLLATHQNGFFLMDKKSGQISEFPSFFLEDYYPLIYDIKKLEHDLYAIATINYGVIILDSDLELKAKISRNEGLKSSWVNQIVVDNSGNIWAATSGSISFIDIHSPLHFFEENSGLPGNVESIQMIGTNFYAGSSSGLYWMPQSVNDDLKPWRKIEAISSYVYSLDVNERDILVASENGLYGGTLNSFFQIQPGNFHTVKFIPGIEKIIALTSNQLFVFDNKYRLEEQIPLEKNVQRSHSIAYEVREDGRTRIWIGLLQEGVIRMDYSKSGEIKLDSYSEMDGLMPGVIKPFNFIGKIIFLSSKGFQHFIPEEEVAKSLTNEEKLNPEFNRGFFDSYLIPDKTIKGRVSSMWVDQGRIYLVLNDQLCYFDERGKKHQKEFSTLNMGRINDLIAINGRLCIATAEGIAFFNPNHFKKMDSKYSLFFRKITTKDDEVLMKEYFKNNNGFFVQQKNHSFELDYSNNSIHIEFSTDYFDLNDAIEYSWKLEGADDKWSSWSKNNSINLNNLHEGSYVLHVKARNIYGTESKGSLISFDILPPWYRTWWAYLLYVFMAIIVIYFAIRISVYRLKQSNIRLENIVKERTVEIENKNEVLQEQNHQILHQKQEITDSINYARRIQEAILPVQNEIKKVFPDSFVLFKPKDIVSGDFYWFSHHQPSSIFICADCTGHGVPGAFMSMICTDRLNHTVLEKKIMTPSSILSEVNQGIKRSLKQEDETDLKTKDGMDAAVCSYNHSTQELIYAGANRPLWILRKDEIIEYKPTKMAVAGFTPEDQIFEETVIKIEKGDIVYLSTDGYADQFGGPKGKKLMVKSFKDLLMTNSKLPFDEQRNKLDHFIENWRQHKNDRNEDIEQVDDICVMGIRF